MVEDELFVVLFVVVDVYWFSISLFLDGAQFEVWFLVFFDMLGLLLMVLMVYGGLMVAFGECFLLDVQVLCAVGFGVLYINLYGLIGYGDVFMHAVIGDWGGGLVDDVLVVIDYVVLFGLVDGERVGMIGNFYGGYFMVWMVCMIICFWFVVVENLVIDLLSMYGMSDIGVLFLLV